MESIERNEIFDLAFKFATETSESLYLTGKAGTGKTTFLKYLKQNCTKNIIVAAPTGVAAINAGGVTLHSLFQLPFHPFIPTKNNTNELLAKIRFNKQRQQILRKMELLVIDEISMVRCDTIDAIDAILKSIRKDYNQPFGGVQLLCIGDLYQLPPVAQNHEWAILQEYYASPFFFDSIAIKQQMPLLIELTKIYRQKEDSFVRLLNKVRNNNMNDDDFEDLHLRYNPLFSPSLNEKYITLTSHNKQAAEINQRKIESLITKPFTYKATIENEFNENNYPADAVLILKEGAQVMFLKNDISKRYFNGKIGIVAALENDKIIIDCDGLEIEVSKETWENTRYNLNKNDGKLEQEILGTFTQYPLRLAWAITIHKSQGLTFDKVMIDAGASFSSGQVYVALSRCTNLNGIVLLSKLSTSSLFSNENIIKGQQSLIHKGSLQERFMGARQVFTQQLLSEIFLFTEIENAINLLQHQIGQQQEKLNENCVNWIEKIKQQFFADKKIGEKFLEVINSILRTEPEIEKNSAAQNRINDAVKHFEPKFLEYQKNIQNHPLLTEHKEVAILINEHLQQLALAFYTTIYFLDYCKNPFSVTQFLQHKLNFSLPKYSISCYASSKKETSFQTTNNELYNTLKRWRDMMVEEENIPIYMIANQASLKEISTYLPFTKKDLMLITGFGKAKVEKYGDTILEIVENYCHQNNIETNMLAIPKKEKEVKIKAEKTDTKLASFLLYEQGKSIANIALERNIAKSTVEGHLAYFISTGQLKIEKIVPYEKQEVIKTAIKKVGLDSLKAIFENTIEPCTYEEIKMVIASLNSNQFH